jgi:hypothetical protein
MPMPNSTTIDGTITFQRFRGSFIRKGRRAKKWKTLFASVTEPEGTLEEFGLVAMIVNISP